MNSLGLVYVRQENLAEAENVYMRTLGGRQRILGSNHVLTPNTVENLAALCEQQHASGQSVNNDEELAKTEQMHPRALPGTEEALGPNHPSAFESANNLADLLRERGASLIDKIKLCEAEEMFSRALTGKDKPFGRRYPSTS